jgi:hypothetical protein
MRPNESEFSVTLTPDQARIFANGMNETEKLLGQRSFLGKVKALFATISAI